MRSNTLNIIIWNSMMKKVMAKYYLMTLFTLCCMLNSSSSSAQCVVANTNFDTDIALCCPVLTSDEEGWYSESHGWNKMCKTDMFAEPEYVIFEGMGGRLYNFGINDVTEVDDAFHLKDHQADGKKTQYGYSFVTAQPKLVHPFCKANDTPNNMYVSVGSAALCPMFSYTVHGLAPGTFTELSFTLYNLLDSTYFEHLATNVCGETASKSSKMQDYITKYLYDSSTKTISGEKLEIGVVSSDDDISFKSVDNSVLKLGKKNKSTVTTVDYGKSELVVHKAIVPESGSVTFYIYRPNDCFQIPIGIDDIEVSGEIKPVVMSTGNPCPEQPLRVTTKQDYPEGTKFYWNESVTGQSSTENDFIFTPKKPDADYVITCVVTIPGCDPVESDPYIIHSGICCTSEDGAPMAMTNLFFDDFGDFVSDDIYKWTDRMGITHTEKIPVEHTHEARSHSKKVRIPYVRAYNIENSGAKLSVPVAGTVPQDDNKSKMKSELFDHGVYVVSKYGGYSGGVKYDNSGTPTGGMLQFDLLDNGSQDDFFEVDIDHICTGKEITFGTDFASISSHPGCIEVTLEHDGNVLESEAKSFKSGADGWLSVNKKFTIKAEDVGGASEVSIKMKVKHNQSCVPPGDKLTRDYAIDNIVFQVCTPPDVNVDAFVNTGKNIFNLCAEDVLTLIPVISDATRQFYTYSGGNPDMSKKLGFVYQYTDVDPSTESETNPITWKSLHKEDVVETETFTVEMAKYWTDIFSSLSENQRVYFRVVVGEYSDLVADQSWKKNSAFSPCRKISISKIPVAAGVNCAECSHLDFEKTGVTFTADNGKFDAKKNVVGLCAGESVEIGIVEAVHGLDKDGKAYNNYDVKWFKENVDSPALATKRCTTDDDDAPTLTVNYDDVVSFGASGMKYIISFHDYYDPALDSTPCDLTDTITVVAYQKPDTMLANPDPFCEGALAQEPVKDIVGYRIDWYEDVDTLMKISVPEIGELKKVDMPKSYFYALTDEKTGCRGEANEYTVEVQSVADPMTGTVTYLKSEGVNGFKKPTEQTPEVVVGDTSCMDCIIVWYDENKNKIDENDATPKYNANLEGNEEHTYYVKQVNKLGCESNFKPVTVIVSGYPSPTVKNYNVCENSTKLTGNIEATTNKVDGANGAAASDFKLVWYNSKADGTIDESVELEKIDLSPSIQKAETGSKQTIYKYYVLQRLASSTTPPYAQSAPVPVTVTVNTNPRLTKLVTDPKCKGEIQKLSEMYNIDIDSCNATYYDVNQGAMSTMATDVITENGIYEVKGWYVINKGTPEEETCSSQPEDLTVVFHELDASIVGSEKTCPGVGVSLDADITVGGGLKESEVVYSWKNDLNTNTSDQKQYLTGSGGLDKPGDLMSVTLEVSSQACNGPRAVTKTHRITVGDGQLVGNISFHEINNTKSITLPVSDNDIEFSSCGGNVEVKLTGIVNKDNTSGYTLSGTSSSKGSFSNEFDGEAILSLGEGRYTLSYINECPTKFMFEITDYSNSAESTNGNMTICEREKWNAEIIDITGPKPMIEWQRNGDVIPGETNAKLQLNPAKPEDSGVYTYTLFSAGCRFDGKIALGNALKVKPYVVLDDNSYEKRYEVVNGEDQSISLEFKVPATVSDIESDVKWSDINSDFSQSGASVTISPVDRDYNLHIVAENKEYCKAETDIAILVDARLKMTAELERTEICEGETTKLIVDTTGTGRVLHPGDLVLKVTETMADGDRTIKLIPDRSTGKLEAEVNPAHNAKYMVTYTYNVGGQDESKKLDLTVHEKFHVELSTVEPVCEGGQATVEVVNLYPSGTYLDWSDNPAGELVAGSISGATFMPIHTGSGVARQTKTYKVIAKNGICQDKPFMFSAYVDKPIEGEIRTADRICQFDELTLDATSYQADTYEWKYEEKDSVFTGETAKLVPDPDYATFTLSMTRGKCSAEVQKYVEVTSAPSVLQVDSIGIRQIEIQTEVGLGTGSFKYIIDGNEDDPEIGSSIRDGLSYSEHVVKVVDEVGCSTEFRFVVNNPAIEIPIHISPNGDGVSDKFVVKGLAEGYPDAKVTIFDRWGKQLATYNAGDGTDWEGVYNGVSMPSTDYWYEIQIKETGKTYVGHFTLIRQ